MKRSNKIKARGEILMENVVFLIITVLFFVMMFIFINMKSNSVSLIEEINAKKIALLIDAAEKDSKIVVDVDEVFGKNQIREGNPIFIDNANNLVIVRMSDKTGYGYSFFNKNEISFNFNDQNGRKYMILTIK